MDSYEEIYNRMRERYIEDTKVDFDDASDIAIRFKVLAGEIYNAQVNMEWLKRQMFISTATGKNLDYLASQRGLSRKAATKSKGRITFYLPTAVEHGVTIPKGTVVATAEENPVRIVTTEDSIIEAGDVLAVVNAEAVEGGKRGNIKPATAVVCVSVPIEIDSTTNYLAFSGGTDEESDEQLRTRIEDSYIRLANGTNAAYYEQLALTVDGITKASAVGKVRGIGTVDVYVFGTGGDAATVAVEKAQELMEEHRGLNVDVKVINAEKVPYALDVTVWKKDGYSIDEVNALCSKAFADYIDSLRIGSRLYLSSVGKALLDTGCIENYEFNTDMSSVISSCSQCFTVGNINIEVN